MSVETDLKLVLRAEDHASAVITSLQTKVDALAKSVSRLAKINVPGLERATKANVTPRATNPLALDPKTTAALKTQFATQDRMSRQRTNQAAAEEKQRRAFESAAIRDLRARLAVTARMARQRLAEIGTVERAAKRATEAAERDAASSLRRQIAGHRYLWQMRERQDRRERADRQRDRRETIGRGRDAWQHGRDAVRDTTRPAGVAALAGSAAAGAAARRILTAESDVDAAEVNTQSYGNLSKEAARALRNDWAAPTAEALGAETAKLLTAWVDATKLGIPATGAKAFAELSTKTSEAWSVPFEAVTDILGTVNTILTSKGEAFSADRLQSVANTLQHLAAKQSTTPEKLMSFLQRGAGGAQLLGMSQEAGLAFGSASTSLGNQAAESGRFLDFTAGRAIEMPRLAKKKSEEGKQAREFVQALGYGSAENMNRRRLANPDEFLPDMMERFNRIKSQKKQDEAIRYLFGREWLGEASRMVKGANTYREAVKLAKEAKGFDAIGAVWELHKTKLSFVLNQFRPGWLNILGELGKVISPMAIQAGNYFLEWSAQLRNGGLAARFQAGIAGFVEGLGFKDFPSLLKGVFGEPGQGGAGAVSAWQATFREFGAGIRDVVDRIRGLVSTFTGGSPETIARWTGRILTLSAALVILSPALTILGGLASAILAIGSAAATAYAAFKIAGLVGGSGAAGAIGTGVLATAGGIIGVAFLATVADKLGILKAPDMSKGFGRGIVEFLDPGIARRLFGDDDAASTKPWSDPPKGDSPKVEKQSSAGDWRGLIQPASLRVVDDLAGSVDRLGRVVGSLGARAQLASIASPSSAPATAFGNAGGGVPGFSSTGGGVSANVAPRVPAWFGGKADSGNGFGTGAVGDGLFGAIMRAEGTTRDGFNTVLGYGRWGRPDKPLTDMSLDEVKAFGLQMRRAQLAKGTPWEKTSSASGAFQITGSTMMDAATALGLDPATTKFDGETQKRMATWIARKQGLGAWEGFKHHPGELATAREAMRSGNLGTVTPNAPTAAGGDSSSAGAADVAARYIGKNEHRDRRELGQFLGHDPAGNANAWCASFVNASLKAVGQGGSGSNIANSFLRWGKAVSAEVAEKGDVLVEHRGRGVDGAGGHVGIATGRRRMRNGRLELEAISGNSSDSVKAEWEDASKLAVRRSTQPKPGPSIAATPQAQQAVEGFRSTGWRRAGEGPQVSPAELLAKVPAAPAAPATADELARRVPAPAARSGGGSGVPSLEQGGSGFRSNGGGDGGARPTIVNIHQTINGAGENPNELAGKVQRHVTEAWNNRAHDVEPEMT